MVPAVPRDRRRVYSNDARHARLGSSAECQIPIEGLGFRVVTHGAPVLVRAPGWVSIASHPQILSPIRNERHGSSVPWRSRRSRHNHRATAARLPPPPPDEHRPPPRADHPWIPTVGLWVWTHSGTPPEPICDPPRIEPDRRPIPRPPTARSCNGGRRRAASCATTCRWTTSRSTGARRRGTRSALRAWSSVDPRRPRKVSLSRKSDRHVARA